MLKKDNNPLVTINILSCNRKNFILNTLTKVYKQDYKNIEVIVVDNASDDGSSEIIKQKFPYVQIIQMKRNIGIAGYNEGNKAAKGKYVLILDDDSYPEFGAINSAVKYLETDSSCGVVAFNIYNKKYHIYETKNYKAGYFYMFIGCGVLFGKKVIQEMEFYDELFFIYLNEIDLSIRIIDKNHKIYYMPEGIIVHLSAGKPGPSKFRYTYVFSNYLFFLIKNFDLKWILIYGIKWNINRLIVAIRYLYIIPYLKGLTRFFYLLPKIIRKRSKVKRSTQKIFNYGKMPLVDREFFPGFEKPEWMKLRKNL